MKKLAPPPGFKGKPKADNQLAAQTDLLGNDKSNIPVSDSKPLDILSGDTGNPAPAMSSVDALLSGGPV